MCEGLQSRLWEEKSLGLLGPGAGRTRQFWLRTGNSVDGLGIVSAHRIITLVVRFLRFGRWVVSWAGRSREKVECPLNK